MSGDDWDLLSCCLKGETKAWERFLEKYTPLIYSSIFSVLRRRPEKNLKIEPQDVYHHILLGLLEDDFRKLRQYEGRNKAQFSTWLSVVSTRMAINFVKRESRGTCRDDLDISSHIAPNPNGNFQDRLEAKEAFLRVKEIIKNNLKPREILFIRLYYEKEVPAKEVASIMNLTVNNVYAMKNRILNKIKKVL